MAEGRSKTLTKILEDKQEPKSFTAERQLSAQAFNLHVELKDGRRAEGFGWNHYIGYQWTDEGTHERLIVLFSVRAIEIEGRNLGALVHEIRDGQLNSIRELASRQAAVVEQQDPEGTIISSVKTYPDFEELLKEIKGDSRDGNKTGFTERIR